MSRVRTGAFVALFLLAAEGAARAQWGAGGCTPVRRGTPYPVVPRPAFVEGMPCSRLCTCGCNANGGTVCPCKGIAPAEQPPNFGLMQEKLDGGEKTRINGRDATAAEAVEAIENSVPEAAKKPRVVVIDADAGRRKQVRDELGRLPECTDCVVQAYPPDHWHLLDLKTRQPGFFTGGAPTVYLLAADGRVLHRQDEYAGGAAAAAEVFRRARADYDPKRDPDRRKPQPAPPAPPRPDPGPVPAPQPIPTWAWLAALGAALLLFFQRRQLS